MRNLSGIFAFLKAVPTRTENRYPFKLQLDTANLKPGRA